MTIADQKVYSVLDKLLSLALNPSWLEQLANAWKLWRKILRGMADEGLYEVLEHEATLELFDDRGQQAISRKHQKVRYLQNNIIAYQDQAWGDGEILLDYRCTPGVPVDRYTPGQKTYILISLREVKHRGDIDVFNIEWGIRGGFVRETELWETEVTHRTKRLKIQVIFPKSRPPRRVGYARLCDTSRWPLSCVLGNFASEIVRALCPKMGLVVGRA
jgi:hypothetical protein